MFELVCLEHNLLDSVSLHRQVTLECQPDACQDSPETGYIIRHKLGEWKARACLFLPLQIKTFGRELVSFGMRRWSRSASFRCSSAITRSREMGIASKLNEA